MAILRKKSTLPHLEWIDITKDGTLTECAIVKEDGDGNLHFIPLTALDNIDKIRLANIVTSRNAHNFPLWDLMSQTTLGNGVNALEYFHQLVKILAPNGTILAPNASRRGGASASKRSVGKK